MKRRCGYLSGRRGIGRQSNPPPKGQVAPLAVQSRESEPHAVERQRRTDARGRASCAHSCTSRLAYEQSASPARDPRSGFTVCVNISSRWMSGRRPTVLGSCRKDTLARSVGEVARLG
ncbi:hypothetical protein PYCCODRAFT_182348 [Trametes coccinea BRFM310]|uniref:Uncharacterized protein n=1 Tax=Trametes coccinea (strain BRFM310) TaxID=1353009 RepID=A0A1Y2I505_TRAC3|nr:hypothetical protein PYCCODRAFT_182348 [Trametes coccinea BRFM310]